MSASKPLGVIAFGVVAFRGVAFHFVAFGAIAFGIIAFDVVVFGVVALDVVAFTTKPKLFTSKSRDKYLHYETKGAIPKPRRRGLVLFFTNNQTIFPNSFTLSAADGGQKAYLMEGQFSQNKNLPSKNRYINMIDLTIVAIELHTNIF